MLPTLHLNNNQSSAIAKTVYNAKYKLCVEALGGRTPLEALLEAFQKKNFGSAYKTDKDHHICHLYFSSPKSRELSRMYNGVLIMDYTYKTNHYKML